MMAVCFGLWSFDTICVRYRDNVLLCQTLWCDNTFLPDLNTANWPYPVQGSTFVKGQWPFQAFEWRCRTSVARRGSILPNYIPGLTTLCHTFAHLLFVLRVHTCTPCRTVPSGNN